MPAPVWFSSSLQWGSQFPTLLSICASASRVVRQQGFDRNGNAAGIHIVPDAPMRGRAARLLALELAARLALLGLGRRSVHFVDVVLAGGESCGGAALAERFVIYSPPIAPDELRPNLFPAGYVLAEAPAGSYTIGVIAAATALIADVSAAHVANQAVDNGLAGQAAVAREAARQSFLTQLQARHADWGFS